MTRTYVASANRCQSFGGRSSIERRFSVGSLTPAIADEQVIHFVRRRRSSSIGRQDF